MHYTRYAASFLLLTSGAMQALLAFGSPGDPEKIQLLVFCVFYCVVGVLLAFNKMLSAVFGLIFPLIHLAAGLIVAGIFNWTVVQAILHIADLLVMVCCLALLVSFSWSGKSTKYKARRSQDGI